MLVVLALYALLPSTFPLWVRLVIVFAAIVLVIPSLVANPLNQSSQKPWSRPLALALTGLLAVANEVDLVLLIGRLVQPADAADAPMLLLSAVQVWSMNVIVFGLIFWQLDRGGPVTRTQAPRDELPEADFRFPQDEDHDSVVEVAAGSSGRTDWTANFIDYLYFSLSNAMAFSPPDAVPLLNRTKILTGIEALGAYVLLVLVIARAVSLLG
ncbi:MAG TPA: hypothetical protein PK237_11900 [Rhodoglobus sp.]|nr:hypothetical protein [Rhodoglobus sp.]